MAQILISDIEDDVMEQLQRRVAQRRRSMEAEIRDIIQNVLKETPGVPAASGTEIAGPFKGIGLQNVNRSRNCATNPAIGRSEG